VFKPVRVDAVYIDTNDVVRRVIQSHPRPLLWNFGDVYVIKYLSAGISYDYVHVALHYGVEIGKIMISTNKMT